MLIGGDDIPVSYDRFRNRVMFPITDLKNRVIAFGGRALDADAPAKYLNSPETPLFHKGHILFNGAGARKPAHDRGRVIAVEGYMDVVALASAGFAESVAPLGTALTEDQVKILWRMADEPILCFDGDSAGKKAAFRAIETALPHLKPGQSLQFAFLPDGLDPDDLIRQDGPGGHGGGAGGGRGGSPRSCWTANGGQGDWSTPERRAQLEQQLCAPRRQDRQNRLFAAITRRTCANACRLMGIVYRRDGASSRGAQGAERGGGRPFPAYGTGGWSQGAGQGARQEGVKAAFPAIRGAKPCGNRSRRRSRRQWRGPPDMLEVRQPPASKLGRAAKPVSLSAASYREKACILRTIVNHPWLIDDWSETIAEMPLHNLAFARFRDTLLEIHALSCPLDRTLLRDQLRSFGQDRVLAQLEQGVTHRGDWFAEAEAAARDRRTGVAPHALACTGTTRASACAAKPPSRLIGRFSRTRHAWLRDPWRSSVSRPA